MREHLRNAGIVTLIFFAALAIYLISTEIKKVDLSGYMQLMGDKLLATVPEGPGKDALAGFYEDFLTKVEKREVAPEQVERVAATILNVSNRQDTLTAEQAESLIRIAVNLPEPDSLQGIPPPPQPSEKTKPGEWESLTKRLKFAYDFNEKVREKNEELSIQAKLLPIPEQIFFKADSGLKIFINKKIKTELSANKLQSLTNDLKELEKAKVLVWQEDIHKEMEKERERFKQELDSLQVKLQRLQQTHQLKQIEIQGVIKSISQLDSLNLPVRVNIDSIRKEVEMELRGVKEAKKKE